MRRSAILTILLAVVATPALAGKNLEGIPLVWKPTEVNPGVIGLSGIIDVKFQVEPFVDSRPDKGKLGENQEGKVPKPVTTSGNVAEFCGKNFGNVLRQLGLGVVATGGDVVLEGEILEFTVTETNTYKGNVRIKVTAKRGGQSIWTGVTVGTSERFGRSYKAENYYETISDSVLHAAQSLAQDSGFRAALAAK